jgi:hypothetical protein
MTMTTDDTRVIVDSAISSGELTIAPADEVTN